MTFIKDATDWGSPDSNGVYYGVLAIQDTDPNPSESIVTSVRWVIVTGNSPQLINKTATLKGGQTQKYSDFVTKTLDSFVEFSVISANYARSPVSILTTDLAKVPNAANANTITLDGSAYASYALQSRDYIVTNFLMKNANYPISGLFKSFNTIPINATGQGIDTQTLTELMRRKAIYLTQWDPSTGNGTISSPSPNNLDVTAYFGATIDNTNIPMSVVIPSAFGGTVHGDLHLLQLTLNPEVNFTFMGPIGGYSIPSLNLYSIKVSDTNLIYEARQADATNMIWRVQINFLPSTQP